MPTPRSSAARRVIEKLVRPRPCSNTTVSRAADESGVSAFMGALAWSEVVSSTPQKPAMSRRSFHASAERAAPAPPTLTRMERMARRVTAESTMAPPTSAQREGFSCMKISTHTGFRIGSMTGMFPPGYLRELRDEWER